MEEPIIFKFNNGLGAILCSGCGKILKTGREFTEEELKSLRGEIEPLPARYCDGCSPTKSEHESWEEIEEEYLKDNYPVFGGPFTDALTPFEWLKRYFKSPKRLKN